MVDSVAIAADAGEATWQAVEGLPGVSETVQMDSGAVRLKVRLDGLRVKLEADGRLFVVGSLTKYACSNNVRNLTLAGVRRAVQDLAAALCLDPAEARVYRVDVGCTFRVPRPPGEYLRLLVSAPRYRRAEYEGETVLFLAGKAREARQARRVLSFYDKAKQAGVEGENLLRFEVQFRRRVKRQLGQALTLADLHNRATFGWLLRRWQEEFKGVRFARRPDGLKPTRKTRDLEKQLARIGLANMGVQRARNRLGVWREEGAVTDRQFFRLKKRINELATNGAAAEDQAIIEELCAAVKRAKRQALESTARTFRA